MPTKLKEDEEAAKAREGHARPTGREGTRKATEEACEGEQRAEGGAGESGIRAMKSHEPQMTSKEREPAERARWRKRRGRSEANSKTVGGEGGDEEGRSRDE